MPRVDSKYNFAILYPELLGSWNLERNKGINPYELAPKSNRKVWWKCEEGHEWLAAISSRTNGHGCYKCKFPLTSLRCRGDESKNPCIQRSTENHFSRAKRTKVERV